MCQFHGEKVHGLTNVPLVSDKKFTYAGQTFHPYDSFTEKETYEAVIGNLYPIGIIPKGKWSYEKFYMAAGEIGQNSDIFVCGGVFVVPCESGLCAYRRSGTAAQNDLKRSA